MIFFSLAFETFHATLTVCFYDDDVLGLIKMALGAVLLEKVDHLADSVQGSVQVGARLTSVPCR